MDILKGSPDIEFFRNNDTNSIYFICKNKIESNQKKEYYLKIPSYTKWTFDTFQTTNTKLRMVIFDDKHHKIDLSKTKYVDLPQNSMILIQVECSKSDVGIIIAGIIGIKILI